MNFENKRKFQLLLIFYGFCVISIQLVFLRYFLYLFEGNELIVSVFLFIWLSSSSLGAFSENVQRKAQHYASTQGLYLRLLFLLLFSFLILAMLPLLKSTFTSYGKASTLAQSVVFLFIILAPLCFYSARLFVLISVSFSKFLGKNSIASAYKLEVFGSILGSLLFSVVLASFLTAVQLMSALLVFATLVSFFLYRKKTLFIFQFLFMLIVLISIQVLKLEKRMHAMNYPDEQFLSFSENAYGIIDFTRSKKQDNVYFNGRLFSYSYNAFDAEELVHLAMNFAEDNENIAFVGAVQKAFLDEFKKYKSIKNLYFIEPNVGFYKEDEMELQFANVILCTDDPILFFRRCKLKFDLIVVHQGIPETLAQNRLFASDFFSSLPLKEKGLIVTSLEASPNYMSDEELALNESLYVSLKHSFTQVKFISSTLNYYLASNAPMNFSMFKNIIEKGINTTYYRADYFDEQKLSERADVLMSAFNMKAEVNSMMKPTTYVHQLSHWMKKTSGKSSVSHFLIYFLILLTIVALAYFKPSRRSLFVASFMALGLEYLFIVMYQTYFGTIYSQLGLFFCFYMLGSFIGTLSSELKLISSKGLYVWYFYILLGAFYLHYGQVMPTFMLKAFMFTGLFAAAFINGYLFAESSKDEGHYQSVASLNYAADLLAAALGLLLVSFYMVPFFGISGSFLVVILGASFFETGYRILVK